MADLLLRIVGKDDASQAFNQVAGASKRLDASTKTLTSSASRSHRAFSTTAKLLTGLATSYAAVQVGRFAKDSISAASDVHEAMTATTQVFKKQSAEIKAWSRGSAADFGQSRTQALTTAREFGTLFKSAGVNGKKLSEYSTGLTELSGDIASFNNVPVQQAIDDLTSGLTGQTEPMRKYGVFLSANALKAEAMRMGIADGTATLTDSQRTLAAYNLILKQTGVTSTKFAQQFGDFDRTAGGLANQTRILSANWEDFKGNLGKALLPLAKSSIKGLNQLIPELSKGLTGGGLGKTLESWGPKAEQVFTSLRTNLPQISGIAGDFTDAAGMIGHALGGVFDAFQSLPDGVRQGIIVLGTAAATMKVLNRAAGGGGMTMWSQAVESIPHAVMRAGMGTAAAESVKALFGNRIGSMNIQAGVVNISGGKLNGATGGPGLGGSAAGKTGFAGALAMLGTASVVSAIAVAAGAAYYKIMDPEPKRQRQGGNPTTYAGGYGSDRTIHTSQPQYSPDYKRSLDAQAARQTARAFAELQLSASDAADAAMAFVWQYKLAPKHVKETARDANEVAAAVLKAAQNKTARITVKGAKEAAADAEQVAIRMRKIINRDARITAKGAKEAASDAADVAAKLKRIIGRTAKVTTPGAKQSITDVENLHGSLSGLRGKTVDVKVQSAQAVAAIAQVTSAMALVQSKTITITINRVSTGPGHATGGLIVGPGTKTSDDIPAMLSNREFVQPAAAVDHYGVAFMEMIRTRRLPKLTGFKDGTKPKLTKAQKKLTADQLKAQAKDLKSSLRENAAANNQAKWDNMTAQAQSDLATLRVKQAQAAQKRAKTDKQRAKAVRKMTTWQDRQRAAGRDVADQNTANTETTNALGAARDQALNSLTGARNLRAFNALSATGRRDSAQGTVNDLNAQINATSDPTQLAELYGKLQEAEESLAQATADLTAEQDAQLEKANQLRDAVDNLAGGFRSFASISTTSVTDVADAQSKLTDATDAVAAAQKKMDLAGSDRERAAAAAELSKALRDQQGAQQGVNDAGKPSSGSIRGNMATKLAKIRSFSADVKKLKDMGLNATTLSDILAMGPEQGDDFAKALIDGGLGDINDLQNQITTESANLGYTQLGTNAASDQLTGYAAAVAAGLQQGGMTITPAPVTLVLDGQVLAQAMQAYNRQMGR